MQNVGAGMSNERTGAVMDEATARAKADEIMNYLNGAGEAANGTVAREEIAKALLAASRPAPGYLRASEGPDMRLLGVLPVTADGCVAGVGGHIWNAYWRDFPEDVGGRKLLTGEWPWWCGLVQDDFVGKLARDYHSSASAARTAAESAKGGRHAE